MWQGPTYFEFNRSYVLRNYKCALHYKISLVCFVELTRLHPFFLRPRTHGVKRVPESHKFESNLAQNPLFWFKFVSFLSPCVRALRAVHMVKKGHKYVTLLQINVPRVMILSQKLGTFIWQGDIFLTVMDIYLRFRVIYLTRRDIYLTGRDIYLRRVTILLQIIRGTKFWWCVRTLRTQENYDRVLGFKKIKIPKNCFVKLTSYFYEDAWCLWSK